MASWFTTAIDKITPWDRKGEVQRRKERQMTTSPAPTVIKPTPTPNIRTNASSNSLDVIKGATKRPTDFGTLQVSNKVSVPNNMSVISNKTPNQAVKPTKQVEKVDSMKAITSKPSVTPTITNAVVQNRPTNRSINVISNNGVKPTFNNDFNKKVDAGSGKGLSTADTLKVTGTAAGRVGLDAAQGIVDLVTAPQKIAGWGINKLTGDKYKEDVDLYTGRYAANKMSRSFDTPREKLAKIRGDDANAKAVEQDAYVIGSLLTTLSPSKLAKSVPGIGKKAWTTADTIMGGAKESPLIVDAIKNIKNLPKNISNIVRKSPKVEPVASSPTNIPVTGGDTKGLPIPTRVVEGKPIQDVTIRLPGEKPALAPVPKPPVRTTEPERLIQDVGGGETFKTPDALVKRNVEQAMKERADRFNSTDTGNMNDITPRKAPKPYKVPDATVEAAQGKIIDDYAAMLKNIGEGNGVSINQATGTRVSNNFRFPGTGSKRLTKAQWRDMAEEQLRGGGAEPGMQKGFDEVTNAVGDTESLLAKGEQVDAPIGKPIRIKEVKGIDVKQVNDVPANTPEVPGTVRVSSQTDPMAAKTQAVANAPVANTPAPIVSPETQAILANPKKFNKRQVKAARNQLKLAKQKAKADAQIQAVIDGMPNRATPGRQFVADANGNSVETSTFGSNPGGVQNGLHLSGGGANSELADALGAGYGLPKQVSIVAGGYNVPLKGEIVEHVGGRVAKASGTMFDNQGGVNYTPNGFIRIRAQDGKIYKIANSDIKSIDEIPQSTSGYEVITSADGSQTYIPKPPQGNRGIAATGEFKTGKRGNVYEVRNRELGMQNARQSTQNTSIEQFLTDNADNNLWDDTKMFEANAILERTAGKVDPQLTKVLASKIDAQASRQGGDLALLGRKVRTSGSSPDITNRFVSRFYAKTENATLTPEQIATVSKVNDEYTVARDTANQLYEQAMNSPTTENVNAYIKAKQASDKLNKQAQFTELQIAKNATKGDKSEGAAKLIKQLTDETDVPDFDYVNANNLSGTGTIIRNNINNALVAAERVKANLSNVRGIPSGIKAGFNQWKNEVGMRMQAGGKNPINWVKNWSTSGNTAGDIWMKGVAKGDATKYYRESLIAQGYSGEELANRTRLLAEADPEQIAHQSFVEQLQQAGLASLTHGANGRKKLENTLIDSISGNFGNIPVVRNLAKGIVNTVLGYPTVTVRNAARGIDRLGLGVPNLIKGAGLKAIGKSNLAKVEFKQAARNAKSGAIIGGIGMALYNADMISFGYPTDKAEQQRWQDERKSEYSIKIGGAWYPISSTLGPFAIPLLAPGTVLDTIKNGGNVGDVAKDLGKMIVSSATPVDDMIAISKALNGEQSGNWWAQKAALLAGSQTPASGLLRQIAKIVDPVVRTTDKTASFAGQTLQNFKKGLPGFSKGNPAMTDSQGNEFTHPNAGQILLGASTKEAQAGVQHNNEMQAGANETYSQLQQYGLLDNQNLMGLVDKKLQAQITRGQDLTPEQITSVQKAVTKGISTSITADGDSNWRENGDYATDRIARQVKLQMLEADPTAKKSDIANLQIQIARDNVLGQNQIPYDALKEYQTTTLSEWRAMGDTESNSYNPDAYQRLWNIDQLMAGVGGSYNTDPAKQKYSAKSSGSGSRSKKIGTDFGTLSSGGSGGPSVRKYEMIDTSGGGNITTISTKRPNIIHKIGVQ